MENNVKYTQYCINVIKAVMNEQPVPQMPEEVSLQQLYSFSKMHSVEAIVYHGLNQLNMDKSNPIWQNWSNRAEMLLTQSIVQLADKDEIIGTLTQKGVDLLPVKGSWLKEQYPQIDFRQMSDLDILIHKEDRTEAGKILQEMGYTEKHEETAAHHDNYEKEPYTAIELHLQLLPTDDKNCGYYSDIWKRVKSVKGNLHLYRMSPEDEYIFYFLHMNHHMQESGCGIRLVLDCVVFRNTYPDLDRVYLWQEFEKLGIYDFVQKIEQLSDCWFVAGTPIPSELQELAECILNSGIYGRLEDALQIRMDALKKKYKNPAVIMAAYWVSRFCRPLNEMQANYPVLEKAPVLLPLFWVIRIMRKLINKPQALMGHVKQAFREGTKNG